MSMCAYEACSANQLRMSSVESLVASLEFCSTVWTSKSKNVLKLFHNSSFRGRQSRLYSNVLVYKTTKLLPVEELIKIATLIHAHNIINQHTMLSTYFMLNQNVHRYGTRSSNHLRIFRTKSWKFGTTSIRNK